MYVFHAKGIMKIKEWEVVMLQPLFLCLWKQDKTAYHAARLLPNMSVLSYSHAAKPYFIIEITIYYFKKF